MYVMAIFTLIMQVLGVIWLNQYARSKQKFYIVLMAITFIFSFSF